MKPFGIEFADKVIELFLLLQGGMARSLSCDFSLQKADRVRVRRDFPLFYRT